MPTQAEPLQRPGKIICAGLNYRDHAEETGLALPERPLLFAKWPSSVIGPDEEIVVPSWVEDVDYEAELGLVVGRGGRDLSEEDALDHIAGVTCVNDVSARRLQFRDGQWTRAKSFDTFCPMGPAAVPLDQVGSLMDLGIRCWLNGEAVQDSSTKHMIFSPAELVAYASQSTTLEPGDLIATGTPAGVGFAREHPIFLRPGDVVSVEIDRVGVLSNRVTAG